MFSRLRLPINQLSEYIIQPITRMVCNTYTTFDSKFQNSKIVQTKLDDNLRNNVKNTKDFNLNKRYKSTNTIHERNKSLFDRTKSLFFLRNMEIRNILDEAKVEDNDRVYESSISVIMRPKNKIKIKESNLVPPEEVETELYDIQYIMDPSYQEILYQNIANMMHSKEEDFNTSGPIIWNLVS